MSHEKIIQHLEIFVRLSAYLKGKYVVTKKFKAYKFLCKIKSSKYAFPFYPISEKEQKYIQGGFIFR